MAGFAGPPVFFQPLAVGLEVKDGFGLSLDGGGLVIEDAPTHGTWTIQCPSFENEMTTVTRDEHGTHVHTTMPEAPAGDQNIVRKGDTQTVSYTYSPNQAWDEVINYVNGQVISVNWPKKDTTFGPTFETVTSAKDCSVVMTNWPDYQPATPGQAFNWPITVSRCHNLDDGLGDRITVIGAPPAIPNPKASSAPWCTIFKPVPGGISVETGMGDSNIQYTADGFILTDFAGLKWEVKKTT